MDFKVYDVDLKTTAPVKAKYNVRGTPTLIYTDPAGNELERTTALGSAEEFKAIISELAK